MKKEIADIWVKALRSGKYKQTKSELKNNQNEFCCLGVLCSLAPREVGEFRDNVFVYTNSRGMELCENETLPHPVCEWSGAKDNSGRRGDSVSLTELNDEGKTFSEIADIIESEWESL